MTVPSNPSAPVALAIVLVSAALGCGDGASAVVRSGTTDGAALYASECSVCHGSSGQGGTAIALESLDITVNDAAGIVSGGAPGMPPLGSIMSAAQVEAVANYVIMLAQPD